MLKLRDRKGLTEMLDITEKQLVRIVNKKWLFRAALQKFFPGPISQVERAVEEARQKVLTGDFDYKYLEGEGLVGRMLWWKRDQLKAEVKTGNVGNILKRIDSFLYSASKAIPILGLVKEYKENVEASMKDLNARI